MFVKSNMSREVRYHKSRGVIVLKPNTVTFVDDNVVSAKELKDCYGDRINIMSRDVVEKLIVETAPEITEDVVEEIKVNNEVIEPVIKPVETSFSDEENENEGEVTGGAAPVDPLSELEDVIGEVDVTEVNNEDEAPKRKTLAEILAEKEAEKVNTGNDEIDAFLNGETDKVPEGTQEITEDEALKLQEEAKKEAKSAPKKPAKKATSKKSAKASKK